MKERNVRVSPAAQNDFLDIKDHLFTLSPEAAGEYYELLMEKISILAKAPDSNPLARDTQLRLRGYRVLPIYDYIAFYAIRGNTVELRRILYAKRQYEQLL